jgi:peroxiredoxin Q/BCP
LKNGIQVIGVSADSVASHQKFVTKYDLPFPLLADEDKSIIEAFGVWGPKKFMGKEYDGIHRTTFLLDEESNVKGIIEKPNTKAHAEEILSFFQTN